MVIQWTILILESSMRQYINSPRVFFQEEIYAHKSVAVMEYNLSFQLENRSLLDLTS